MSKHVKYKITFKKVKPKALYDLFMNSKLHSMISDAPVTVSPKTDAPFSSHKGYITGRTIHTVKDKLIMQNWRAMDWEPTDPDSTFTIMLEPSGKDTILHAVHSNIPDAKAAGIELGWQKHYWKPWKQWLSGKKINRPSM